MCKYKYIVNWNFLVCNINIKIFWIDCIRSVSIIVFMIWWNFFVKLGYVCVMFEMKKRYCVRFVWYKNGD